MLLFILRNSSLIATKCFCKVVCGLCYCDVDEVRGLVCSGQGAFLCVCITLTFDLLGPDSTLLYYYLSFNVGFIKKVSSRYFVFKTGL